MLSFASDLFLPLPALEGLVCEVIRLMYHICLLFSLQAVSQLMITDMGLKQCWIMRKNHWKEGMDVPHISAALLTADMGAAHHSSRKNSTCSDIRLVGQSPSCTFWAEFEWTLYVLLLCVIFALVTEILKAIHSVPSWGVDSCSVLCLCLYHSGCVTMI